MKKISFPNLLIILMLSFLGIFPRTSWGRQEYKIGAVFPLTGEFKHRRLHQANILRMLVKQINEQGGVKGNPLKVIIEDSQMNPETAVLAVQKLINRDKVIGIIGPSITQATLAVIPVVEQMKVPLISCSFGAKITEPVNPWVFQSAPRNTLRVDKALTDMRTKGISRLASFGPTSSKDLRLYILTKGKELGLKIVEEMTYDLRETEDQIIKKYTQIDRSAQAILNYHPEIKISKMRWEKVLGSKETLFYILMPNITMFNLSPSFPKYESIRVVTPKYLFTKFVGGIQQEKLQTFAQNYIEKYEERITIYDIPVYEALRILVSALENVGPDTFKIRDYIEGMSGFVSVTGTFNFSPKDHNGLSAYVFEILTVNKDNGCPDDLHKCVEDCSKCADSEKDC